MSETQMKRILLVEDEALIAMSEKMQLEQYSYAVRTVATGEEAAEAVRTSSDAIDLILMDINLGEGIDGTQAAEIILQERDIPIVFLSSHTAPEVVEKTEKITSYGYVVKDSNIAVLDASIKMAFKLFDAKQVLSAKEEALLYKHEFMSYVIEHNRSAIAVHDRELKYLYVSERYLDSYRVDKRDVIGRHHYEVFPDLPQKWRDVHQKALRGEVSSGENDPFEREDGTTDLTRWECRPWYEQDGTIGGIIVYTEVITEQKRTERKLAESVKLLSQAQKLAHIGNWHLDLPTNRLSWSDEIYRIFGCEPQEFAATYEAFLDFVHPDDRGLVDRAYTRSVQEGKDGYEIEHRIVRRDSGDLRYVHERCDHERDDSGTIVESIGMVQDITERKQAEDELKRFKTISDNAVYGKAIADLEGQLVYSNRFFANIHGYEPEDLIGRPLSVFHNEQQLKAVERLNASVMQNGSYAPCTVWHCHRDGTEFPMLMSVVLLRDDHGDPQYIAASAVDISSRVQAEEKYRLLFNYSNDAIFVHEIGTDGVPGRIIEVNEQACRLSQYGREELLQMSMKDIAPAKNRSAMPERARKLIEKRHLTFEAENLRRDGSTVPVEVSAYSYRVGGKDIVVSSVRDITERKRLERELEESSKRYQVLVERSPSIIYLFGTKSGGIYWSEATRRILGIDPQDVVRDPFLWNRSVHPDDKEKVDEAIAGAINGNPFDIEYRIQATDGRWVWLRDRLIDRSEENGEVIVQGHAEDITRRKHQQEALETERQRLSAILAGTNVGTWEWNVQTGETRFNERWASIIGYTLEDISPVSIETWQRFAHPEDLQRSEEALRAHFAGEAEFYEVEARMRHKDGHWVWVFDRGKVTTWTEDGKPEWVFGTHQDMTEHKRIEEEIRKQLSERETLLREVHHRVKNNMATIESFVSLQTGLATTPEVKSALQDVISRVQSMRVLYDKLLQSTDLHEVSMKSYAEDLIDSLLTVFDPEHKVTTETQIADFEIGAKQAFSLGIIINELLTNVFKYAFESMDSGTVSISINKDARSVMLTIQDNGVGFDERALKNESPGFGLTVVRMLVEETGGTYTITNDHGAKSVVRFEV